MREFANILGRSRGMKNYKVLAAVFAARGSLPFAPYFLFPLAARISARYSAALIMKLGIAAPVGHGCHS